MPINPDVSRIAPLLLPRYSYADADYLAHVSRGTARRWISGYSDRDPQGERILRPPVTRLPQKDNSEFFGISFLDLVEIAAIGTLKEKGFSVRTIKKVVENIQEDLQIERPLVSLRFKTDGKDLFVQLAEHLLSVRRRRAQYAWDEVLGPFLENVDYTADRFEVAERWWPMGHDEPVLVDPDYGFGLPVVKGSGVRTETLLERFRAQDSIQVIARDFGLEPGIVERALQFEYQRAA